MAGADGPKKNALLLKLAIVAAILIAVAVVVMRGVDVRGLVEQGLALIRTAGPEIYFTAMAILPAFAVPALTFTLTAGPVFGPKLGLPLVVTLSLIAMTVNMVITYALARRALRPFLERLMTRLGYKLPEMDAGDLTDLAIVTRVTPGVPFFVQNYLLGLAGVPFGRYLLVSCVVTWIYTAGFVLFGDALLHGKGRLAMLAASVLVLAVVATHWARKHYGKKRAAQRLEGETGP